MNHPPVSVYNTFGATKMRSGKKSKIGIPGIVVTLIVIVFLGLGVKGGKYIINHSNGKLQTGMSVKTKSVVTTAYGTYSSSDELQPIRSLSDCQIIAKKNLFEQLGGRKEEPPQIIKPVIQVEAKKEPPRIPPEPINDLVLTGIVYINNVPLALIEDSSKGKSYFLKKGDKLKDYTVDNVKEGEISLVNENSKITLTLGSKTYYNTNGKLLASAPTNIQTAERVMEKPSEKSASSNEGNTNLSLIEQMKARRKKELGQE
jgi:hypothetical protein